MAVDQHFPGIPHIADRFHVVRLASPALENVIAALDVLTHPWWIGDVTGTVVYLNLGVIPFWGRKCVGCAV